MSTKKSLYHVSINSQGYLLAGTPKKPARKMRNAPKIGELPETVDLDFADASQWLPWAQTDWSGKFQTEKWEDTASFKLASNIDTQSKYGQISLQLGVTAVKTDFTADFTYGASIVWNEKLIIGTSHPTAAEVWQIESNGTKTEILASKIGVGSRPRTIADFDIFQGFLLMASSVGIANCFMKFNGTTWATINGMGSGPNRMVKVIGDRIYLAVWGGTVYGDKLVYSDDGGATSTVILDNTLNPNSRFIIKGCVSYGTLYFLIKDGHKLELWKCQDIYPEMIYSWSYLVNPDIKTFQTTIKISGEDENGKLHVFEWTGGQLNEIFIETIDNLTASAQKFTEYRNLLLLEGLGYDGEVWFPHINASISGGSVLIPFASFGSTSAGNIYFYGTGADGVIDIYKSSGYAITGYVISGIFDGSKPAIDKLWYSVDINCKALATGESIEIQYSTDNEANWTSLGTASEVGTNKKTFYFPASTFTHQIQLKAILNGDGTTTPTLYDVVLRYRPMGDERYQWQMTLKCFENMQLLDDNKTSEPKRGIEIRNQLLIANETKSVVNFEDIDFFETALNGTINAAVTTITVDSTTNAPERGRFKIDNEWITYTGKSATTFIGCSRGARGTLSASHSDDATVSNIYKIMVTDYQEITPVLNNAKAEDLYVSVNLIEM